MIEELYLGDRVYASFDGSQLRLRCSTNVIYLEPMVFDNLRNMMNGITEGILIDIQKEITNAH